MTIKKQAARRSLVQQAIDLANAAGSPVVFAEFDGCPHLESAHHRGLLVSARSITKAVKDDFGGPSVIADVPPEEAWTSTEDPGERVLVRGRRYEIWRRVWPAGRWILVQWDECVSEHAAAWIARCRGHLPPGEPLPEAPVLEIVEARRRAEDRALSLAAALSEAEREIAALRAALALSESP